jgi:hypothetical protein
MGLGFFLKGQIIGFSLAIPVGIGFTWPIQLLFSNTKDSSTPTTPAMHFGWPRCCGWAFYPKAISILRKNGQFGICSGRGHT